MSTVLFERHGTSYTVRFHYDPALVELLKAAVRSHARSWDPSLKQWQVQSGHAERLASALRATGHQVIGLVEPQPGAVGADPFAALFDLVGPGRVDRVHRALARVLHPDAGGDTELMRRMNVARDRLNGGLR